MLLKRSYHSWARAASSPSRDLSRLREINELVLEAAKATRGRVELRALAQL